MNPILQTRELARTTCRWARCGDLFEDLLETEEAEGIVADTADTTVNARGKAYSLGDKLHDRSDPAGLRA
jgi:hypothetical protein